LEGGPPRFPQDTTCPAVLKECDRSQWLFVYWAITVFGEPFQDSSTKPVISYSLGRCRDPAAPYNPDSATTAVCHAVPVWAVPVSFATTQGISFDFSSSGY
jgi:hypothetical protein